MATNDDRKIIQVQALDLQKVNEALRQLSQRVNSLEGKTGRVSIRDSIDLLSNKQTMIDFTSDTSGKGSLCLYGTENSSLALAKGARKETNGEWVATDTVAVILALLRDGDVILYTNSGLTIDQAFNPTEVFSYGLSTHWEDLRFPAIGINPIGGGSDPAIETDINGFTGTLLFSASAVNTIAGVAQMPHAWKEGTTIYPHIHWCPTNTDTKRVAWKLSYQISDINGTFSSTYTTVGIEIDNADGVANKHQIHPLTGISMTGKTISCMVLWKLERIGNDGSDDYTGTARLLEFDIHYEIDTLGSRQEYIK